MSRDFSNIQKAYKRVQLIAIILYAALFVAAAFGHEDPWGDVHPYIEVQGGEFVVWFRNTTRLPDGDGQGNYQKTTGILARVSTDGTKLLNRKEVEDMPPLRTHISYTEAEIDGARRAAADWKDGAQDIGGFSKADGKLFFHISPFHKKNAAQPMYLGVYSLANKSMISWVSVGIPGRIYDFAVASKAIYSDGHLYLAWIEERDRKTETVMGGAGTPVEVVTSNTQIVLTKWEIGRLEAVHLPIRQTLGDNSHLDIAIKEDNLLIAWHEGIGLSESCIGTAMVDLSTASFTTNIEHSTVPTVHESRLRKIRQKYKEAQQTGAANGPALR